MELKCGKCGYIFSKTPNKIKSRRDWCSKCSGKASPTIKELKKLAFEVGVEKTGKPGNFISKKFLQIFSPQGMIFLLCPNPTPQLFVN